MTAAICLTLYALGLGMALAGEFSARKRLGRMAHSLRARCREER